MFGRDEEREGLLIEHIVDGKTPENAKDPGDDLFSQEATLSVSSALESLTSVFGMGTGVASPLKSPGSRLRRDDVIGSRRVASMPAARL